MVLSSFNVQNNEQCLLSQCLQKKKAVFRKAKYLSKVTTGKQSQDLNLESSDSNDFAPNYIIILVNFTYLCH